MNIVRLAALLICSSTTALAKPATSSAATACVTITRDDWGIAHVHGRSDADAVFGMIYAQAEDDFARIEANYLASVGRTAEADGEKAIWADLRARLFADPIELKAQYQSSAPWLRKLMDAWAAGLNYYLDVHPEVRPKVITRFEPWMVLSFTEGSIGGDIERINLKGLQAFYEDRSQVALAADDHLVEPTGSNGIAIAPQNTRDGHTLLLINPHTSFFFRSELQMTSDDGLDAYGAATWGQFFIYQGFNRTAGWMHTSSGVDAVDEFAETVIGGSSYRYGDQTRTMRAKPIAITFKDADGSLKIRTFTALFSHHGPIVRTEGGKWIAFGMMWKPVPALEQSYLRTKAKDYAGFLAVARRQANSSNDTIFADAKGTIAYLHPQFVPLRDDRFDYRGVVDGSDPATGWKGLTPLAKLPQVVRPASGWIMNTNDEPWGAAGPGSITRSAFPRYMDMAGENPRGEHATKLLSDNAAFTPASLIAAAYDSWQPTFATNVPSLIAAYDRLPPGEQRARLAGPVDLLRGWDYRWSATSLPTTLAVFWGTAMWEDALPIARAARASTWDTMKGFDDTRRLMLLDNAVDRLTKAFGGWKVPWSEVNRFQRNDAAIVQSFDDAKPSTPVPFTSALWGSLASFGSRTYPGIRRWYGTSGNSFVAVVEFGPKVRAWAVTAGGESGDSTSPHFKDQASRYAAGDLRPVYLTPADLKGHIARTYHPGD